MADERQHLAGERQERRQVDEAEEPQENEARQPVRWLMSSRLVMSPGSHRARCISRCAPL
jgi:hypothetical protein